MQDIANTLEELDRLTQQIATLTARHKELRMSLLDRYDELPKSNELREVAQVAISNKLYRIKPHRKDGDEWTPGTPAKSKAVDVTVTSDTIMVVEHQEKHSY